MVQPAKTIEGRVLDADTGDPVPRATIQVVASDRELGGGTLTRFRADEQGRFTTNPYPGNYFGVSVFSPDGQPYLVPEERFAWTKGTVKKVMEIKVRRGVLIQGKVTVSGTGRPLSGASVQYIPAKNQADVVSGYQAVVASTDNGSFQIVVQPGKGHLFVYGPTSDYILETIGSGQMLRADQPGGWRDYAHRIIPYEFAAGRTPHEINVTLRPAKTIKGRAVGPMGPNDREGRDHHDAVRGLS